MRVDELSYDLPEDLIAQRPLPERDASRLLLGRRYTGGWEDHHFAELPELLRGDELLVFNNARVLPARLFGHRTRRTRPKSFAKNRSTASERNGGSISNPTRRRAISGKLWYDLAARCKSENG